MKRILLAVMACTLAFSAVAQQVVHDDWQRLQIEFNTGAVRIDTVIADGQQWAKLSFDGSMPVGEVGDPMLPAYSTLVEVPLCKDFELEINEAEYETFEIGLPLLPMQPSRSKSDTARHPLIVNPKAYSSSNTQGIGGEDAIEAVGIARDRRLARLQYSPVTYVPATGKVTVCRKATVTVNYVGADREATLAMFERYHSEAFASGAMSLNALYPKSVRTSAPVRYLIVAHSQFRDQMDDFVQWKRRKGFITDIVYTDNPNVGTTTTSIQSYIQSQYTNATAANPAPTYLLLVGDVAQIPAFDGTTQNSHITDLYYTTWSLGDHLPDCYHGRFSAQNLSQLQPQIDKTLMYEQYTFADPTFLDRAVMVAGVDGGSAGDYGYTHADPAMDYAVINYINGAHGWSDVHYFKNDVTIVPSGATNVTVGSSSSSNAATVRSYYNQGAGWINYSAHGGSTGWGTPSFGNDHVAQMTNVQKFGILIGNCCQTNTFGVSTCFGEALLRKDNYCGAMGYIGGSDYTYWGEDFYWAVGVRSGISATMSMAYNSSHLGAYDRLCHTHGEAYSQWAMSQGSLMMLGNMAVESSSSGLKHYYWEIYHLMGDPSVMVYLTQADIMSVTVQSSIVYGTATLTVTAVPHAYIALTDTATHTLQCAAFADASGHATLTLPSPLPVGGYELAASAQQYRTAFQAISVVHPAGAFPMVTSVTPAVPLVAGDTTTLTVTVENPGNATAQDVVVHLSVSNPALTLLTDSLTVSSMAAGAQQQFAVPAVVSPAATDGLSVTVGTTASWTGMAIPSTSFMVLTITAPKIILSVTPDLLAMQPGDSLDITVGIVNKGHAALPTSHIALTSPTGMVTVRNLAVSQLPALQPNDSLGVTFRAKASTATPSGITLPLALSLSANSWTLPTTDCQLHIGQPWFEAFDGVHTLSGWSNGGNRPWEIIDSTAWQGSGCTRSAHGLSHNQSSELTLTAVIPFADSVKFRYAVSSESGYDKFHFYLDTTELITASGEVEWTQAAFPISAGTHTLRFTYTKDYSVSNGHDCAWVDMLTLPHTSRTANCSTFNLCQGQPFVSHGDTVPTAEPASFVLLFEEGNGITIEEYTVHPATIQIDTVTACDSYVWHGVEYTQSCNTTSAYSDIFGCDSTSGLRLTIWHSSSNVIEVEGCDSCVWNETVYRASSNLSFSYTDMHGCDSSVSVKIRVYHPVFYTDSVTTSEAYEWNGETYTEDGVYTQVLSSVHGCDSTVTLVLTIDTNLSSITSGQQPMLHVWPNPTTGNLTFSGEVQGISVYDLNGRLLFSNGERTTENGERGSLSLHSPLSTLHSFDLSSLPAGVYMLRVTTAEGQTTLLRLVKQ